MRKAAALSKKSKIYQRPQNVTEELALAYGPAVQLRHTEATW